MSTPQTIQIFLPSGDPQGLRQAEITTRTLRLFDVPRPALAEFMTRPESDHPGIYFLFGQPTTGEDQVSCYIGESDNVSERLKGHNRGREFWDRALVAVSLTNSWTKAHVRYMEREALMAAKAGGRFHLVNGNEGFGSTFTPEPMQADCDEYLQIVSTLTATLGFPVLRPAQSRQATEAANVLHLRLRALLGATAGTYGPDGFTVFGGTILLVAKGRTEDAGKTVSASTPNAEQFEAQRTRLMEDGIIAWNQDQLAFAKDHVFKSPSGAASFILGRSANGWVEWQDSTGRTLGDLERS